MRIPDKQPPHLITDLNLVRRILTMEKRYTESFFIVNNHEFEQMPEKPNLSGYGDAERLFLESAWFASIHAYDKPEVYVFQPSRAVEYDLIIAKDQVKSMRFHIRNLPLHYGAFTSLQYDKDHCKPVSFTNIPFRDIEEILVKYLVIKKFN